MVRWFSGSLVLAYINIYTRTEPGFPPRALVENFSQIMQNFLNHNRFAKLTVATLERELRTKWHNKRKRYTMFTITADAKKVALKEMRGNSSKHSTLN